MNKFRTALMTFVALTTSAFAATYTVKPGDTLYKVARAYNMDAAELMKLNGMSSTTIQVGQKLTVGGEAAAAAPAAARSSGGAVIRTAATRYLGIRYVLGGNGNGSIDCSSYTMNVMRQLGVNLPRTAAAQWNVGRPVSRAELREGDLVFFNTTGRGVSHVGLYMGNGMMANANSYYGKSMIEPLFGNSYWAKRYLGARRVLN